MNANLQQARDEWIALRCQFDEPEAFADLVQEMERPLLYFVRKLVNNEDKALDVLQELWLKAFRTIRRLENPKLLRTWLYRLARGLAIDRIRKDLAVERHERIHVEQYTSDGEEPSFEQEDAAVLHRMLDTLEMKFREVLVLHFLEEMSISDISLIVSCPEGTVKSRIHHAKRALQRALRGDCHE